MSGAIDRVTSRLVAGGLGEDVRRDEPLRRHTYYRIGGPASLLVAPRSMEALRAVETAARDEDVPVHPIGLGSNFIALDAGYPGVVVKLTRLDLGIERLAEDRLRTGCSVAVSTLLRHATQQGWGGLEFLTGVPGSMGGVVAMNAGTHLGEAKDRILAVELLRPAARTGELEPLRLEGSDLRFEYRHNLFLQPGDRVVSCEWRITPEDPAAVKALVDLTLSRRKASQPVEFPSCGSVFKNPHAHGLRAWEVVEKLGLRGHRVGNAQISEKHPNFIVNLGEASASDVLALIALVKKRALEELGIPLEEEVRVLSPT